MFQKSMNVKVVQYSFNEKYCLKNSDDIVNNKILLNDTPMTTDLIIAKTKIYCFNNTVSQLEKRIE